MSEFSPIRSTTNIDPQRALQQSVSRSSLHTESESGINGSNEKHDAESANAKPSFDDILNKLNQRVNDEIETAKRVEVEKQKAQEMSPHRNTAGFINARETRSFFQES